MNTPDDIFWLRQLRDLERYCNKKGYRVVYKSTDIDVVYYEKKLFILNDKLSDEITLYHLLHEIGHLRVMNKKKSYSTSYNYIFNNFSKTSLTHQIATLQEELDAWREGLKLAEILDIHVDRRTWEIAKTKCISTYLSWVEKNRDRKNKRKLLDEKGDSDPKSQKKK